MKIFINPKDLRRDTFHCGGHGGQNVNSVETGVRYVHVPTGLVGESRDERKQGQNDARALDRLIVKLKGYFLDKIRKDARDKYEAKPEVSFGHQIKTYFLCGQKRMVDHRTGKEFRNVQSILDGNW